MLQEANDGHDSAAWERPTILDSEKSPRALGQTQGPRETHTSSGGDAGCALLQEGPHIVAPSLTVLKLWLSAGE